MRQALANLVTNAVRHTPDGTPIDVIVRRSGEDGTVAVRDHGAGLPEGVGEPPRGLGGRDLTVDTRARSPLAPRTSPISPPRSNASPRSARTETRSSLPA